MKEKQIHLGELIAHLQAQQEMHGDLPVYYYDDAFIGEQQQLPRVSKIFTVKEHGLLNDETCDVEDKDLYGADLDKPVVKGIIL